MGNFMGGSAPAMAGQVADGFILMSAQTLKAFLPGELNLLRAEIDKLLRETRAGVPPQDDAQAQQARHRRIARLNSALQVINNQQTRR
jgi:hypothetical protein